MRISPRRRLPKKELADVPRHPKQCRRAESFAGPAAAAASCRSAQREHPSAALGPRCWWRRRTRQPRVQTSKPRRTSQTAARDRCHGHAAASVALSIPDGRRRKSGPLSSSLRCDGMPQPSPPSSLAGVGRCGSGGGGPLSECHVVDDGTTLQSLDEQRGRV